MDTPPPPVQMVQMLAGFQISQALYAAARLGIPDALAGGPRTTGEVSAALGTDRRATARLLRSLAGLGVFADAGGDAYALTPLGRTLVGDAPGSMRDLALMWMETHYEPFGRARRRPSAPGGPPPPSCTTACPFFEMAVPGATTGSGSSPAPWPTSPTASSAHAVAGYDLGSARPGSSTSAVPTGAMLALLLHRIPRRHRASSFDLPHVVEAVPKPWRRRTSSTSA